MQEIYTLNAFANIKAGGNPAAVMLDADNLNKEQMQEIARKIGFSETAFIKKSKKASFKIDFFTPNKQVDICGHATIAAFTLLRDKKIVSAGKYTQETLAGVLAINVEENAVFMQQNLPQYYNAPTVEEIAASLNIVSAEIDEQIPLRIVSTGLKDIMVSIKNLDTLLKLQPDFKQIKKISSTYDCVGMHVFSLETLHDGNAHCRNFAPLYDIYEEAATGTSNGALACYLYDNSVLPKENCRMLKFEQGDVLQRPSEVFVKLDIENNSIENVFVGGNAQIQKCIMI